MIRSRLHELVDALPESEVHPAKRYLQFLIEKVQTQRILQAFKNAPEENEAPEQEELEAIAEAEKDIAEGKVESFDKVMKDLGI